MDLLVAIVALSFRSLCQRTGLCESMHWIVAFRSQTLINHVIRWTILNIDAQSLQADVYISYSRDVVPLHVFLRLDLPRCRRFSHLALDLLFVFVSSSVAMS